MRRGRLASVRHELWGEGRGGGRERVWVRSSTSRSFGGRASRQVGRRRWRLPNRAGGMGPATRRRGESGVGVGWCSEIASAAGDSRDSTPPRVLAEAMRGRGRSSPLSARAYAVHPGASPSMEIGRGRRYARSGCMASRGLYICRAAAVREADAEADGDCDVIVPCQDQGQGIGPELHLRIFEAFWIPHTLCGSAKRTVPDGPRVFTMVELYTS
ncbi:hypothetical protein GGS23DRAFT_231108 [Durotheca rogersii]|uniref:uncharacterized protein n=1 Tax=Durotheca rogersii TaxID=419775 RepID=UPI002220BA52|nr:uncharacterized protein GGS23DRAFT_231108 [Durotheca rogersii]KAI5860602.1 hypothetical protein GGS23DRAFT_231108 [Durotheca rogersii]